MIEIEFLAEDIEGVRDFGIALLQNNIIYRMRKQGRFIIFEILTKDYEWISCIKMSEHIDESLYNKFGVQFEPFTKPIEFKAFALKIY